MNTRKASLRKLRLPGAMTNKSRNGHQKSTTTISNYFSCEESSGDGSKTAEMTVYSIATPSQIIAIDEETTKSEETPSSSKENPVEALNDVDTTTYSEQMPSPIEAGEDSEASKPKRALRTKLSTFLPKEKRLKTEKRITLDFETPKKVVKRAPKAKPKAPSKKQQKIKSAFFKHEERFSEVTAQHCLADNINPDEMQMALALSRSEAEISMSMVEGGQDEDKSIEEKEGIRDKLKQFGFRVAESEDYNLTAFMPARSKTKWANKFTPLTLRNPQRQLAKVNERVENFLSSQFASEDLVQGDDTPGYSLKSAVLEKFLPNDQHVIRFDATGMLTPVDFYVLSLIEPSRTKAGHLLKDVRLIAGRDVTPKKVTLISKDTENDELFQSPVMKKSRGEEAISSSCPSLNRNLLGVFDRALTQPVTGKESVTPHTALTQLETGKGTGTPHTGIEALREVTSMSLNVMNNIAKGDKMDSACDIKAPRKTSSNDMGNDESFSISTEVATSTDTQTASSPIRCTSPDIFADSDSDSDIATEECADIGSRLNASKSSSSDHHITTYEIFSSDEVKTFSANEKDSSVLPSPPPVIDLTQCGSDSSSQPSQKDAQKLDEDKETTSHFFYTALTLSSNLEEGGINGLKPSNSIEKSFQLNGCQSLEKSVAEKLGGISFGSSLSQEFDMSNSMKGRQSLEKSVGEKLRGISFGSSVSEEFDKSNSMRAVTSEISIDLTQNDDEEDDCILLSDDEVNYSMWQANKTGHIEEDHPKENISIDHSLDERNDDKNEFSFIELVAGSQPLPTTQSDDFDNGIGHKSNTSLDSEVDLDLSKPSDFGILEEHSPFKTPTKPPKRSPRTTPTSRSPKCRKELSESFISSPAAGETTPEYGSSKQSIHDNLEPDLELSKLSDFGILDEQSPFKTPIKTPRKSPTSASPKCRKTLSDSFKTSPAKRGDTSATSLNDNSQLDLDYSKRSDFGILDEQSPFKTPTKTPKKTPRKTPASSASPRCRKALSESFILSPGDRATPIKRFSSINKFTEFTKCDDDDENLSDLDEIDKLIYGSPSKRAYKKPAGLDQLLTGPINTKIESPQKPEPDSPKEFVFNGRTYLVRTSNVSEMLDYEGMDESALLNQLYKYGIRRLKRKQAIKVLEYIYKQTHPCLVDVDDTPTQPTQAASEDENGLGDDHFVNEHPTDEASSAFKFNLKDCWGHLLVSSADIQMEIEDEQYIVQTNTSKKTSTALLPFHIAWYNLVKSNKLLHEAILHYEPIDLQEIFVFFKRLGYRYDPKELKYFFDSRSIIFRYELNKADPSAGSNRHTRKRTHKSTQRSGRTKIS